MARSPPAACDCLAAGGGVRRAELRPVDARGARRCNRVPHRGDALGAQRACGRRLAGALGVDSWSRRLPLDSLQRALYAAAERTFRGGAARTCARGCAVVGRSTAAPVRPPPVRGAATASTGRGVRPRRAGNRGVPSIAACCCVAAPPADSVRFGAHAGGEALPARTGAAAGTLATTRLAWPRCIARRRALQSIRCRPPFFVPARCGAAPPRLWLAQLSFTADAGPTGAALSVTFLDRGCRSPIASYRRWRLRPLRAACAAAGVTVGNVFRRCAVAGTRCRRFAGAARAGGSGAEQSQASRPPRRHGHRPACRRRWLLPGIFVRGSRWRPIRLHVADSRLAAGAVAPNGEIARCHGVHATTAPAWPQRPRRRTR